MKKILYIFALLLIAYSSHGQVALPTGNLEAWYPVCGNDATDHGGIGYDLINVGATPTTDRFGFAENAFSFDGASNLLHYTTFFSMAGPFSYSCWIFPTAAQNSIILYNGNPSPTAGIGTGMGLVMDNGAGGAGTQVSIYVGGGIGDQVTSVPLALGTWHHVVLVRTGFAYVLYVNSVYVGVYLPVTTPSFPGFFPPVLGGLFQVGGDAVTPGGGSFFTGRIDDIAIYSRLLTYPTEVNKVRDFKPDISFNLGPDLAICPNEFTLPTDPALTFAYPYPTYRWRYDTLVGTSLFFLDSTTSFTTETKTVVPSNTGTTIVLTITRPLNLTSIGTGNSCTGKDTINLRHIAVKIDLGPDATFCRGGSLTLNYPPTAGETFHWNIGYPSGIVTTDQDTVHIESRAQVSVAVDSVVHLTLSDSVICHGVDTINVNVPDSIKVNLGPDAKLCLGGSVLLYSLDSATYGHPAYAWGGPPNVGGSTTSVTTATVSGTYWLTVNDSNCVASDTIGVTIVFDTVHVYNVDTAICHGQHIVTSASFNSTLTYQWRPSAGIPSSSNPATTITPDTSAWYVLTASIEGCDASDSFYLDVQPNPFVYAGGNRFVCEHDTIRITPTIIPAYDHYKYDWSPGTYLNDSTADVVIFTPGDTTKLYLVVTTPAGCTGNDSAEIYTHHGDFASLNPVLRVCPGDSVQLTPTSTEGVTTYVWHPSTYLDNPNSATPWIRAIVSEDYYAVATSQYGCLDTVNLHVIVNPAAVITLEDSVQIYPGESYHISPQTNVAYFSWWPHTGMTDTSVSDPVVTPPVNTTYIVTGRTENNCMIRDSIAIRVDEGSFVALPNAFTPGYGPNNTLKPLMAGLIKMRKFNIYNRWGEMVYTTTNVNEGWDGALNGKAQPLGVYVYEIEAVTDKGTVVKRHGNITLIR